MKTRWLVLSLALVAVAAVAAVAFSSQPGETSHGVSRGIILWVLDWLHREEFSLLLEDAAALLEAGADAIVSGFLTPAGDLDRQRLARLVELCHRAGKRFTLHRAFDMCRDPFAALELCKELGVDTVLTSGQKNTCLEGLPLLEELWPRRGGVEPWRAPCPTARGTCPWACPALTNTHCGAQTRRTSGQRGRN